MAADPPESDTLAARLDAIERAVGGLPPGVRAILARLLVRWRADDYGAGREGRAQSQSMAAIKPT